MVTAWRRTVVLGIGLAILGLTGCGSAAPGPAPAPAAPAPAASPAPAPAPQAWAAPNLAGKSVRVMFNSSPDPNKVVPVHALHLLEQWGAKVQIDWGSSSQVSIAAITSGQSDVLSISIQGALSAVNNGVNLQTFALSQPRQDYVFVSRPNVPTLADLKGKNVGILDMAGINSVHARIVLDAAKLTLKDVNIIEAGGQGARAAALLAGRLDGTMFGMSNWLKLQKDGYHLLYSYTKDQPNFVDDIWWAKPEWLKANPEMAQAMNEALLQSYRWFNDTKNKDAFIKETAALVKGSDDAITAQLYDLYRENSMYPANAILSTEALTFNQKTFVDLKSLPKALPVDTWADFSYATKALARVGKQ